MKTTTGNQAAGNNTTGIGTGETMAEMKTPAAQPVVVTQIAPAKAPAASGNAPAASAEAPAALGKAPAAPAKMTLAEVRAKLDGKTGRRFWKNLDE